MNTIIHILLIFSLVLQIIVLGYMLVCQIKRQKEDKKFWEAMSEAINNQLDKYNDLCSNVPIKLEEDESEQPTENKE